MPLSEPQQFLFPGKRHRGFRRRVRCTRGQGITHRSSIQTSGLEQRPEKMLRQLSRIENSIHGVECDETKRGKSRTTWNREKLQPTRFFLSGVHKLADRQ